MRGTRNTVADPGQATVEFALILPLFAALVITFVDISSLVRDQLLADQLARDAARMASTATSLTQATSDVDELMNYVQRGGLEWSIEVNPGIVKVSVSLAPRTSMLLTSLQWLGAPAHVTGTAVFPTEFEMVDH